MLTQAQEALLYDREDTVVFQIRDPQGAFIAGSAALAAPPPLQKGTPTFFDSALNGHGLRVAAMLSPTGYSVQVGETLNKRNRLIREILAAEFVPTLAMAFASLALAWTAVAHGLKPLSRVRSDILARRPDDLRPLNDSATPSEIRPLIEAFNRLLARFRESYAVHQRFLANAAHQLRTPLAGLQMHLELLLHRDLASDVRRDTEQMHAATVRAGHLANQLLTLANAEASADRLPAQAVNLRTLIEASAREWVPRAIARDIDLGFDLADAVIDADPMLIAQMLDNLIDNALRYTPSGGVVTVRCGLRGAAPYASVEDSGPGIPQWAGERIFERFFRLPGSPGDGAGLGLAIAREVCERHRARIEIDGTMHAGTRFVVTFAARTQGPSSGEISESRLLDPLLPGGSDLRRKVDRRRGLRNDVS